MKSTLAIAIAFLAVAACSKNEAPPSPSAGAANPMPTTNSAPAAKPAAAAGGIKGSCNKMNKTSKCDEYSTLTMGLEESTCKELEGVWGTGSCPKTKLLGTCKKPQQDTTTYYYATDLAINYTAQTAKEDCEDEISRGTWAPAAP